MIFTLPSCPRASSLRTVGRRWPRRWLHLHWRFDDGSCLAGLRFLTSAPESTPLVNGPPGARAGGFGWRCRRLIRWQVRRRLRGKRTSGRFPRTNRVSKGAEQHETIPPYQSGSNMPPGSYLLRMHKRVPISLKRSSVND